MKGVLDRGVNSGRFCKVLMTLDCHCSPAAIVEQVIDDAAQFRQTDCRRGNFFHKPVASLPIMRTLRCWDGSSTAKPSL